MKESRGPLPRDGAGSTAGLAAVLLLAAAIIGAAWHLARDGIADNAARNTLSEVSTVLPSALYDNAPHKDVILLDTGDRQPLPIYRARRGGRPVAAAVTVDAPGGYQGPIRLLVGVGVDGKVLGVHVQAHSETPGIGARVATDESPWIARFTGRSLADPPEPRWALKADGGDFDAIAGATVSSRAVVGGVHQAVQYFMTHQEQVFGSTAGQAEPR
jgi:electron transport complex protein RnfG